MTATTGLSRKNDRYSAMVDQFNSLINRVDSSGAGESDARLGMDSYGTGKK